MLGWMETIRNIDEILSGILVEYVALDLKQTAPHPRLYENCRWAARHQ